MNRKLIIIGLQFLLYAVYVCTNDINIDELKSQLPGNITIPPEFANVTLDDVKNVIKEKCSKQSGAEAYNELELEIPNLMTCVGDILNTTAMKQEIDEASPKGELDVVFNKYCRKRPLLVNCIESFKNKVEPCLDSDELVYSNISMRIVSSLLNFICHKDGDQIALFIAEKGPECFESSKDDITACVNSTFSKYIPKEGYKDITQVPKITMGPDQCRDLNDFQDCVVRTLEKCEEITPANIVESMFRFIRNETTCPEPKMGSLKSSASNFIISTAGLFMTILLTFAKYSN